MVVLFNLLDLEVNEIILLRAQKFLPHLLFNKNFRIFSQLNCTNIRRNEYFDYKKNLEFYLDRDFLRSNLEFLEVI